MTDHTVRTRELELQSVPRLSQDHRRIGSTRADRGPRHQLGFRFVNIDAAAATPERSPLANGQPINGEIAGIQVSACEIPEIGAPGIDPPGYETVECRSAEDFGASLQERRVF